MNEIKAGSLILEVGDSGIVDAIIKEGAILTYPNYKGKLYTHCIPTFPIDENFINVCIEKYAISDPNFPDSREWIKEHLYGKPAVGGVGAIEMLVNGLCGGTIEASGYLDAKNIIILEPVIPWNDMALKQLSVWDAFYFKNQIPYDYMIYPEWALKIGVNWIIDKITGLPIELMPWIGETTNIEGFKDASQYKQDCIELGERMINWACFGQQVPMCFTSDVNEAQPVDAIMKCIGDNPFFKVSANSPLQL